MAVASRSIRSSGISFRNIFYPALGIILIVALFFIPEIIQFQKSVSGTAEVANRMKTLQTSAVSIPKDQKDSQLSRISSLIESGYLDKISNVDKQPDAAKLDSKSAESANQKEAPVPTDSKLDKKADKAALSWKAIKSKASTEVLKSTHKEIMKILVTLGSDKRGSRFALLNLANGMEEVLDGDLEKSITATAALKKIEALHAECLKEFLREGVGHVAYKRFVGLDFGPVIGKWSLRLSGQLTPFNPQLTLTELSMSKRKIEDSNSPVAISFAGYVVGEDVARIELISGGVRLEDLVLKSVDKAGFRKFKSKRFELNGKVLFKVYDKRGRLYQKLYSFYPRARIFENRKGRYLIPKPESPFDNRLDRFFTYQIVKSSQMADSFLENQGFERF